MAGVTSACRSCSKQIWDDQTVYGLCDDCCPPIPIGTNMSAADADFPPVKKHDNLIVWAANTAKRDRLKANYLESLGHLTHRELLLYTVNLLDGLEIYEADPLVEYAGKHIREIIEKRGT